MIVFPDESLPIVSKAVADFTKRTADPKLALHVFIMDVQRRGLQGQTPKPGIAFLIYDAHGEEHAKSEAGFKWAFDIAGAMVASPTANLSIRQVNNLQGELSVDFPPAHLTDQYSRHSSRHGYERSPQRRDYGFNR
jgi:cysteine desulfurase